MSNFVKIIFIAIIIGIITFLSILLFNNRDKTEIGKPIRGIVETEEIYQKDLRVAVADSDTFNPILSKNRNIYEISKVIYEPLVSLSMNYELEYTLAERIDKKNATQYIVYLKDVKWHDGSDLKSEDFHFTYKQIKDSDSIYKENIESIASIKSINDKSFIITLKSPVNYFEYKLTFPIMKKVSVSTFKDKNRMLLGTGLYKYKEAKNNVITFEVFEEYWNKEDLKETNFKELHIYKYNTVGEVYNAFKSGNIDIINSLNNKYIDQIGTYGYIDTEYKSRDFYFLAFNTKKVNKNIRKAISLSIDKEKLVKEISKNLIYSPFPTDFGHWTYPHVHKLNYKLDDAKKILTENGYELKNGKWVNKETKKNLKFELLVNADNSIELKTATKLIEKIKKFGIEITLRKRYGDNYYNEVKERNYDLAIIGRRQDFTPSLNAYFGPNNYSSYNHNEIQTLLKESIDERNNKKVLEKYNEIYNIYLEDIPFIGLYRKSRHLITSLGLHMDSVPNSYNMLYNISYWYRK